MICVQFSPNKAYVAGAGNDCAIHIWNVNTQRQIRVCNGHSNKITSICFTADSKYIFSGSHDRTIKLWDTETSTCKHTISAHSSVNHLSLSPDEYYLASAHLDGCIRFWSWRDQKQIFSLDDHKPQQTTCVLFAPPEGVQVLTASKDGRLIIWDLRKQRKLHEIVDENYKNVNLTGRPCYSPDGKYIVGGSSIADKFGKYPLFIWQSNDGKLMHKLSEHKYSVTCVEWDVRGGVASCVRGGNICTWC